MVIKTMCVAAVEYPKRSPDAAFIIHPTSTVDSNDQHSPGAGCPPSCQRCAPRCRQRPEGGGQGISRCKSGLRVASRIACPLPLLDHMAKLGNSTEAWCPVACKHTIKQSTSSQNLKTGP